MKLYFVSRHKGAKEWASKVFPAEEISLISHLDIETLQPGDIVLGTLPVHLVAKLCKKNCRYFHLQLDLPQEMRGKELTYEEMELYGANLEEYSVNAIKSDFRIKTAKIEREKL